MHMRLWPTHSFPAPSIKNEQPILGKLCHERGCREGACCDEKRGREDASRKLLRALPPSFDAHCAHSLGDISHYMQSSGNAGAGKDDVFLHTKITSFPAPTMKIVMGTLGNAVLR
jgi:hypothetical protein